VNKLSPRRPVFVKRYTHEMTPREVPGRDADDEERCSSPNLDREPNPRHATRIMITAARARDSHGKFKTG
jgi:hypothetical protein